MLIWRCLKMKRLNNRGYVLIEIILASAIAFGIAYFILDLTIKLKNKNDDLVVRTLTQTDRGIITNRFMSYMVDDNFSCNNVKIVDNTIKYNDEVIDIVNKYAKLENYNCSITSNRVNLKFFIKVMQLEEENFNVDINYYRDEG